MKYAFLPSVLMAIPSSLIAELMIQEGVLLDRTLARQAAPKVEGKVIENDPVGDDILLMQNGDVMHGTFGGIQKRVLWNRSDTDRPIPYNLDGIRQIFLKRRESLEMEGNTSFFNLVSGDRIPGRLVSLDNETLAIQSGIVGDLKVPRDLVKSITPNPFEGELFYSGPYDSNGWVVLDSKGSNKSKDDSNGEKDSKPEEKTLENSPWIHSGAAFYNLGGKPLALPDARMPDIGRVTFRVEWKGRVNLTVSLLSDFTRVYPTEKKEEENQEEDKKEGGEDEVLPPAGQDEIDQPEEAEKPLLREERLSDLIKGNQFQAAPWLTLNETNTPLIYGSGYTMTIYSSYPNLARNSFSDEGQPVLKRMPRTRSNVALGEQGSAEIEIRYNREKGLIMLFIDGEYASQWTDLEGAPGDGRGLAILNNTPTSRIKISEILVTSWNGMKDNANSMSHPERDVLLLVNGTDRFSGNLTKIADGIAHLESNYLDARIPVGDLAKIVLRNPKVEDPDADAADAIVWDKEPLTVLYEPYGLIRLIPVSGDETSIKGTSPFLGEIKADISSASLLRFLEGSPDLSDWFDDF